jgi:hypothetical protein
VTGLELKDAEVAADRVERFRRRARPALRAAPGGTGPGFAHCLKKRIDHS